MIDPESVPTVYHYLVLALAVAAVALSVRQTRRLAATRAEILSVVGELARHLDAHGVDADRLDGELRAVQARVASLGVESDRRLDADRLTADALEIAAVGLHATAEKLLDASCSVRGSVRGHDPHRITTARSSREFGLYDGSKLLGKGTVAHKL